MAFRCLRLVNAERCDAERTLWQLDNGRWAALLTIRVAMEGITLYDTEDIIRWYTKAGVDGR